MKAGLIKYTIPKNPNSPRQKYRLTSKSQNIETKKMNRIDRIRE
jgi:hypothetical protein